MVGTFMPTRQTVESTLDSRLRQPSGSSMTRGDFINALLAPFVASCSGGKQVDPATLKYDYTRDGFKYYRIVEDSTKLVHPYFRIEENSELPDKQFRVSKIGDVSSGDSEIPLYEKTF